MKNVVWLSAAFLLTLGCNNFSAEDLPENTLAFVDTIQSGDNQFCFESQSRDRVYLSYDLIGNDVSGQLGYAIQGKDRQEGTVRGEWIGDTLLLDYLFQSEGALSSRQVIFLKKDSLLIEGYGTSEERDGKIQFIDRSAAKFGDGIVLVRKSCETEEPVTAAAAIHAVQRDSVSSQGSEVLYMYRWELMELNGQKTTEEVRKQTFLEFKPGQVGQVSGKGGCNRLTGTFELSGSSDFKFGPFASTKMACPGMDQETAFLKALSEVNQWKVVDNVLFLQKNGTDIAVFQSVSKN